MFSSSTHSVPVGDDLLTLKKRLTVRITSTMQRSSGGATRAPPAASRARSPTSLYSLLTDLLLPSSAGPQPAAGPHASAELCEGQRSQVQNTEPSTESISDPDGSSSDEEASTRCCTPLAVSSPAAAQSTAPSQPDAARLPSPSPEQRASVLHSPRTPARRSLPVPTPKDVSPRAPPPRVQRQAQRTPSSTRSLLSLLRPATQQTPQASQPPQQAPLQPSLLATPVFELGKQRMTIDVALTLGLLFHISQHYILGRIPSEHPMYSWRLVEGFLLRLNSRTCTVCRKERDAWYGSMLYNIVLGQEAWEDYRGPGESAWNRRTRIRVVFCCGDCAAKHSYVLAHSGGEEQRNPGLPPLPYQTEPQLPWPNEVSGQPRDDQQEASAWLCAQPVCRHIGQGQAPDVTVSEVVYVRGAHTPPSEVAERVLRVFAGAQGLDPALVTRIEVLHNRRLAEAYQRKRSALLQEFGRSAEQGVINERMLWHGSPPASLDRIRRVGFQVRCANTDASLGAGVYFAQSARYSLPYCKKPPGPGGVREAAASRKRRRLSALAAAHTSGAQCIEDRCQEPLAMVLARVLLGRVDVSGLGGGLRGPLPEGHHSTGAASWHEGTWQYAVFDNASALPEFVVYFDDPDLED